MNTCDERLAALSSRLASRLILLTLTITFVGCAHPHDRPDSAPGGFFKPRAVKPVQVQNLPKSRYGNMSQYTVRGKQYKVMDTAAGFAEKGIASWYGTKFHGRKTSSGEIYDMYALTAAHKHLPLPTFVRVTNIDNGRQLVVKVNDRGPFITGRIIDLSYAAAIKLGVDKVGVANVSIEALSTHHVETPRVASNTAVAKPAVRVAAAEKNTKVAMPTVPAPKSAKRAPSTADVANIATADTEKRAGESSYILQLGAFSEPSNAKSLVSTLAAIASPTAYVEPHKNKSLYLVKMGPIAHGNALNTTLNTLKNAGIDGYTIRTVVR